MVFSAVVSFVVDLLDVVLVAVDAVAVGEVVVVGLAVVVVGC